MKNHINIVILLMILVVIAQNLQNIQGENELPLQEDSEVQTYGFEQEER